MALAAIVMSCVACGTSGNKTADASLPFYTSADMTPHWYKPDAPELKDMHRIAPFAFTDQDGNTITQRSVEGKIYVADFFFTRCPGICPTLTKNLGMVQEAFKTDTSVLLLSHSVTPDLDSVPVLKRYANDHQVMQGKWHLLTGNKDSIYNLARRSYFADEDLGQQKDANDFLHTENVLLIDRHLRIRGIYKGTSAAEMNNLIADIKTLQQEEGRP